MNVDPKTRIIDGVICLSSAALCEVFGVTRETLSEWAKKGCPKVQRGWWPLGEVIRFRGLAGTSEDDDASLAELKLKYEIEVKRLQAEGLELKNAVTTGALLPRDEVVNTLMPYFAELKRSLKAFGRTIATEVAQFVDPVSARRIGHEFDQLTDKFLRRIATGNTYAPTKGRTIKRRKT